MIRYRVIQLDPDDTPFPCSRSGCDNWVRRRAYVVRSLGLLPETRFYCSPACVAQR